MLPFRVQHQHLSSYNCIGKWTHCVRFLNVPHSMSSRATTYSLTQFVDEFVDNTMLLTHWCRTSWHDRVLCFTSRLRFGFLLKPIQNHFALIRLITIHYLNSNCMRQDAFPSFRNSLVITAFPYTGSYSFKKHSIYRAPNRLSWAVHRKTNWTQMRGLNLMVRVPMRELMSSSWKGSNRLVC